MIKLDHSFCFCKNADLQGDVTKSIGRWPVTLPAAFAMKENQIITNKQEEIRPSNQVELSVSKDISFEDFKKSLGSTANKYTDEQIEYMRVSCDKIADLVFETWLNRRNAA